MAELDPRETRHLILDRDGVLNEEAPDGGYVREPEAFRWLPGALEALARLRAAGVRLSVVTNQAGVGKGLLSLADLDRVHARMTGEAAAAGGAVDAIFCCTHAPEAGCACRKPAPGLVTEAIRASGVDPAATLLVGDDHRDLEAGRAAGIAVALVRTGKGRATERALAEPRPPVFDDLGALAAAIAGARPVPFAAVFAEHAAVIEAAGRSLGPVLERVATALAACVAHRGTVFACGNGGSASDAQHLVGELVGRFRAERRALAAVTLGTDPATLTAVANDYGYERVFARQLEALARPGDLLFAISTSGNSPNVLAAVAAARARGVSVVALTGAGGGRLAPLADLWLEAPSKVVARIQEVHGLCIHALCEAVDAALAEEKGP